MLDNDLFGLAIASPGTSVTARDCLVSGTRAVNEGWGDALIAWNGASVVVQGTALEKSENIGLVVAAAAVTVEGSRIAGNHVGVHVQDGSSLAERDKVPAPPESLRVAVSKDTVFEDNAIRVGSGLVPLPAVAGPPP